MVQINLREYYPHIHDDRFVEVSDDVAELFLVYRRSEASYARKARRYHAYFSLDRQDGIEQCIRFISISPEEHFERQLSEQQLYAALNSLPPKQARRIFAHYFDGISQAEIGRAEGITRESVNESLRRGLSKLKTFLEIPVCTLKTAYTVLQVQSLAQRSEKRGGATMVHTGAIHASR